MRPRTYSAFTLIELLVVIAIIALLLAILVPSLAAVKEIASVANCLSNQRGIAVAYFTYAQENDDKFCSGYIRDSLADIDPPMWVKPPLVYGPNGELILASDAQLNTETRINGLREGALYPYLESTDVFHCPGDKRLIKGASRISTDSNPDPINVYQIYRSYGMPDFYRATEDNDEKKMSQVTTPGSKLLFVEDQYDKWYNIEGWSYIPGDRAFWDPLGNYHNKSCTFAFADGHAKHHKWRDARTIEFMSNRVSAAANGYGKGDVQDSPFNPDHDFLDRAYPAKTRFKNGNN